MGKMEGIKGKKGVPFLGVLLGFIGIRNKEKGI
jgi:hypothetical protein